MQPGDRVLDACCGTGDLAIAAADAGGNVTGVDFSKPMLERARRKDPELEWVEGDALALPFADESFDAATVGFGVRNLSELDKGLARAAPSAPSGRPARDPRDHAPHRLRSPPSTASGSTCVIPAAGKVLPGGSAYTYLPASVRVSRTRRDWPGSWMRRASARSAGGCSPAGSSRCTRGVAR